MKAQSMVSAIEEFLASNIGIAAINVDGQLVKFNREGALQELSYWKTLAAKEQRKRSLFRGFNIGSAW